jgi:hypothetical protein
MTSKQYRIVYKFPLHGSLLPLLNVQKLYNNPSLAVALAVKTLSDPTRQNIQVVEVDSGEVIFETGLWDPSLPSKLIFIQS